ncbi:hypothetical protein BEP19_10385 [Ammoniphilus oxalaticus]|uniref:YbbR-like domain-containing protein YbbR n=1 Tax=Ammoniphilus oxalaticus TaxID=66863 RepID=A0A419SFU9_9BACL|nr:CdaR family protein [Ammoniphilus oxalaticus]RKD22656.1 hypothetical protein BEP19_10385 [Ammoniphilus oxalaticus]
MMDRLLRNNNAVKIVALFLAIALWFVVNGNEPSGAPKYNNPVETYRISEVSLTPKYDSNRLAIIKMPKTVTVELKGAPSALNKNISPSDYEVYIDLTDFEKGAWKVPVHYSGFPSGLSVRVIPEKVDVVLEEKQTVEKDVIAQFVGDVAEGYSVGEAILTPKRVHVTLPESKIREMGQVQVNIDIASARAGIEQTVPIRVLDKKGNPLEAEVNPAVVEVKIPVTSPNKQMPIKMSYVNESPAGFSIEDIKVLTDKVTVYGPLEVIDKLNFYPGPEIDLAKIKEDRFMQLKVPLLPNVIKTEPDFIELEINITSSTTRTFEDIPISINGLGDGLKVVFISPENGKMPLMVQGSVKHVNELTKEDIQLYIDSSNLPPGEHEAPVLINLPTFISTMQEAQPLRAVIRIEKVE